jgi:hypothetical protein
MEALAEFLLQTSGWLLDRFRRLLDRLPGRDPSTLPWWHRLARLVLAIAICLAILILLGWLIWR